MVQRNDVLNKHCMWPTGLRLFEVTRLSTKVGTIGRWVMVPRVLGVRALKDEGFVSLPSRTLVWSCTVALHAHRLEAQHILNTPPSQRPFPPAVHQRWAAVAPSQGFLAPDPCRRVPAEPKSKRVKQFLCEIACT